MEAVLFKINGQPYGMRIEYLEGIEEVEHVTPVANAPSYITGITNVRGEIVPVFNLMKKFSLDGEHKDNKFLLVRLDGAPICLSVDEVDGMKKFEDKDVFDLPTVVNSEVNYFDKVLKLSAGELALVVVPELLMSDKERSDISQFVAKMK